MTVMTFGNNSYYYIYRCAHATLINAYILGTNCNEYSSKEIYYHCLCALKGKKARN